jgi:hypothetical protein
VAGAAAAVEGIPDASAWSAASARGDNPITGPRVAIVFSVDMVCC